VFIAIGPLGRFTSVMTLLYLSEIFRVFLLLLGDVFNIAWMRMFQLGYVAQISQVCDTCFLAFNMY